MSAVSADLVVPQLRLTDALERRPLAEVRERLESLREVTGLGPKWRRAELVGLDRGASAEQVSWQAYGMSWSLAPVAGVGFARDGFGEPDLPSGAGCESPPLTWTATQGRLAARAAEVQAVRRAALVPAGPRAIEVSVAIDLRATARFTFGAAYRRRLAHLLAFEASLRAGSLEPYTRLLPVLTDGSPGDLAAELPAPGSTDEFSVTLNIVAALREGRAYQQAQAGPHPDLGGRLHAADAKERLLVERLEAAAARRGPTLHEDGRRALAALSVELERVGDVRYTGATIFPRWGLLGDPGTHPP